MYREKKIGVVIPAYNEELLIKKTLNSIPDYVDHVYVVNDCSPDRTGEIVKEYAENDNRVVPLSHEVNKGVGAAIVTGYQEALKGGMDIAAVMAGDNQMDPIFLPKLLDPIVDEKADYTVGNRLLSADYRHQMSMWRFFGNSILTLLTKIASGYWQMMDPQNGYTAISARALGRLNFSQIYPRYGYCNDLLIQLNVWGFKMKNIPHPARYGMETSGIKYSSYICKLSWLLLRKFLWRLKMKYVILSFHPLVFFYILGTILSTVGIIAGIITLWEKFITGNNVLFVHGVLSFLAFMMGMMFLLFAMLYDMEQERNANGWY
ncbi:glycosyltransferase family 2 protein [Methanogenium organophilum]|uniref:Glycosyltransferase family 2 protein n=1 Tax=Methanogenium organophilum TaxID=2199 RepID=A0A9X9S4P5_METOG|nr:glycosyltransferase family 2 protein [Methanogenium organophilum]WAI00860.1 glycosyltransferase family 2 protein [Methanogenium organophilum]